MTYLGVVFCLFEARRGLGPVPLLLGLCSRLQAPATTSGEWPIALEVLPSASHRGLSRSNAGSRKSPSMRPRSKSSSQKLFGQFRFGASARTRGLRLQSMRHKAKSNIVTLRSTQKRWETKQREPKL